MALNWEATFNQLVDALLPQVQDTEQVKLTLVAEDSQFTRFNQAKARQTGTVRSGSLALTLMDKDHTASQSLPFTGDKTVDWPALMEALTELREELPHLPEDPYLVLPSGDATSRDVYSGQLLSPDEVVPALLPGFGA